MIFTLKNANFNASKIGTLNTWRVVKVLKGVTTDSTIVNVNKDGSYSATFNVSTGYELNSFIVTMGDTDITSNLTWSSDNKVGTLVISKVTNNIHISIIADAIINEEEVIKQYTITYKYITESGQMLQASTTEKVIEGTVKDFNISMAPEIEGYIIKEVSPTSVTITGNATVSYIYKVEELQAGIKKYTWYSDFESMPRTNSASLSYASYSYNDAGLIASYINKPIKAFRMEISVPGIFSYGKTDGTTYTELGTINITQKDQAGTLGIYDLNEPIVLVEGERLWFSKSTDTAIFKYGSKKADEYPSGKFDVRLSESNPNGNTNTSPDVLGIDIGTYIYVEKDEDEITWYTDILSSCGENGLYLTSKSNTEAASFAYGFEDTINLYRNKPINAFKLAVAQIGEFSYGKVCSSPFSYEKLGTINFTEVHSEPRIYELENVVSVNDKENIWFQSKEDTGLFKYYSGGDIEAGKFYAHITNDNAGSIESTKSVLGIEIGGKLNKNYPVEQVSINPSSLNLVKGKNYQLTVETLPLFANNKEVIWSASNSNCSVTQTGLVYGMVIGDCVITATAKDGGSTATCNITVVESIPTTWYIDGLAGLANNRAKSITSSASFTYRAEDGYQAKCIGKPINVLRFAVAQEGTFTYGKAGSSAGDLYETLGTLELKNVSYEPQIFTIPEIILNEGERLWFQGVNDTGFFYYGSAVSAVPGCNGFRINVHPDRNENAGNSILGIDVGYVNPDDGIRVTGVDLVEESVQVKLGESLQLTCNIMPSSATNKNLIWSTSNENCSVVNGIVTGNINGKCTITVRTEDGGFEDTCEVKIITDDITWYVDTTSASNFSTTSNDTGAFAYSVGSAEALACENKTINAFRLAAAVSGTLTYGITNEETYTIKGTISIVSDGTRTPQVYQVPPFKVYAGERVFFSTPNDTGRFYYCQCDDCKIYSSFTNHITPADPNGQTDYKYNLSIDIGIMNTEDIEEELTGITLNKEQISFVVGDTYQFTVSPLPAIAKLPNIVWSVSNEKCTVDQTGLLTAVEIGECVLTITTEDRGFSHSCNITVVDLDEVSSTWYINATDQSTKTNKSVSSAASFAYNIGITSEYYHAEKPINALSMAVAQAGTFTYGKYRDGIYYNQLGTIEFTNPSKTPQLFKINPIILHDDERLWFQKTGDTGLFYFGGPRERIIPPYLTYITESTKTNNSSGDEALGIDIGFVNETEGVNISRIMLDRSSTYIKLGTTEQLSCKIIPSVAARDIIWTASNNNCTITTDGKITANAPGNCVITVTTVDSKFTQSFSIDVVDCEPVWYTNNTTHVFSIFNSVSAPNGGYGYLVDSDEVNACIGVPINVIRLGVAQSGEFTYGKTDGTTVTTLGTINIETNGVANTRLYYLNEEITLSPGERLWFSKPGGETGKFYYCSKTSDIGRFDERITPETPAGTSERSYNLSIDIGYISNK